jgi:hypothetical protein
MSRLKSLLGHSARRLTDTFPLTARWPDSTSRVVTPAVCLFLTSSITVFLLFYPVSQWAQERLGPSLGQAHFFAVEPRNFGLRGSFGELQTRKGDGQLTEIAEVRHVASAYW